MPGGLLHVKFSDGREAEVPEDSLVELERRASARGLTFDATPLAADNLGDTGQKRRDIPMVPQSPQQQQPQPRSVTLPQMTVTAGAGGASGGWDAPVEDDDVSPLERLGSMFSGAMDTVDDSMRGLARGGTLGYANHLVAAASPGDYQQNLGEQDALDRGAEERSPIAYPLGRAVGGILPAAAAFRAMGPRGALAAMGLNGAMGAAQAGTESRAPQAAGAAQDTLEGGGIWFGLGALGEGVSALAGWGSKVAAPYLERVARNQSYGGTKPQLEAYAEQHGLDAIDDISAAADRLGLTGGSMPRSPMTKANDAAATAAASGRTRQQALQDATLNEGVAIPRETLDRGIAARQGVAAGKMNKPGPAQAGEYAQLRGMIPADEQLSPLQVDALRRDMYEGAGLGRGEVVTAGEAPAKQAQLGIAREARQQLHNSMREQALPETEEAFFRSNQDVQDASTLSALAKDRALRLASQSPISLGRLAPAAMGMAAGAADGPLSSALAGAVGYGASRAAQVYGPDIMANAARGAQPALSGLAAAGRSLAPGAFASGAPGMAADAAEAPAVPRTAPEQPGTGPSRPALAQAIYKSLEAGELGTYGAQFAQAFRDGQDLVPLFDQLARTDPEFRQRYVPAIIGAR